MSKQLINIIINDTETLIESAGTTEHLEFIDGNNNPIPAGLPYHIHITTDKSYWYMTSGKHETDSILIFRADGNDPSFVRYRKLYSSKRQSYLYESKYIPTEIDYRQGSIQLYFAKQSNDTSGKVFEIGRDDFLRETPFYLKTQINLLITGDRTYVEDRNKRLIDTRDLQIPGLKDVLSPLYYFKPSKPTRDDVLARLDEFVEGRRKSQRENNTTSSTTNGGGNTSYGY